MVIPICDSFHDDPGRVVLGTVSFASAERELFNGEAKRSTEILLHRTYEMYEALEWFEKTMKNEA